MLTRLGVFLLLFSVFLVWLPAAGAESVFKEEWEKLAIETASEADNGNVIAMFKKGVALAMVGDFKEAAEWFDLVSEHPHRREEGEDYRQEIEKKLVEDPENHVFLGKKAFLHFTEKDYNEAMEILEKMEKQDPENIWLDNYRALILVEEEKYEEAREILYYSLEKNENRYTRAFMGYAYWQEGQYGKATTHFLRTGTLLFSINEFLP